MQQQKKQTIDIFFVLTLFCLYTLSSLFLAIIGANIYEQNVAASEANYNIRTSALYVTEKARQSELQGSVRIDKFEDNDALVLSRTVSEQVFETWIYVDDGYLNEILVPAGTQLIPGIGQKIMPLQNMTLALVDVAFLEISVTDVRNNSYSTRIFLECDTQPQETALVEPVPTETPAVAASTEIAPTEPTPSTVAIEPATDTVSLASAPVELVSDTPAPAELPILNTPAPVVTETPDDDDDDDDNGGDDDDHGEGEE